MLIEITHYSVYNRIIKGTEDMKNDKRSIE